MPLLKVRPSTQEPITVKKSGLKSPGNAAKREQLYAKSVMRNYDILSTSQTPTPIAQRIGKAEEMAQSTQRLRDMKMASKGLMQLPSRPAKKKS